MDAPRFQINILVSGMNVVMGFQSDKKPVNTPEYTLPKKMPTNQNNNTKNLKS